MRRKSLRSSAFSSTRMGNRPCSSGNKSDGLVWWKAPEAINRMWSVLTAPCFVANRRAFDQRQEVALHPLPADVRTAAAGAFAAARRSCLFRR